MRSCASVIVFQLIGDSLKFVADSAVAMG
jgi:hypothetical protein